MSDKSVQLFILPYAGGSVSSFKRVVDLLDSRIDAVTVEYAGRGTRRKEPLSESIDDMIQDAITFCNRFRDESIPYAVLGYSMGTLLEYEMLQQRAISGELKHMFVAAEVAPNTKAFEKRKDGVPTDENIIEKARSLGGLDERMLSNPRAKEIYINPMISDFRHFFEYRFEGDKRVLNSNVTFFYCDKDTNKEDVKKWEDLIKGEYDYYEMGDNHFFINQCYVAISDIINSKLV